MERKSQLVAVVGMPNVGKSTSINALRAQAQYDELKESRRRRRIDSRKHHARSGDCRQGTGLEGAGQGKGKDMLGLLASGGLAFSAGGSSGIERRGSRKGEKTGPTPGVTRHLKRVPLGGDPPAMLLDSPGIMVPQVDSAAAGCKLALCGLVRDIDVPAVAMVEALLLSTTAEGRARIVRGIAFGADAAGGDPVGPSWEAAAAVAGAEAPLLEAAIVLARELRERGMEVLDVVSGERTAPSYESESADETGLAATEALCRFAARRWGMLDAGGEASVEQGAEAIVERFRRGVLGRHTLDGMHDSEQGVQLPSAGQGQDDNSFAESPSQAKGRQ